MYKSYNGEGHGKEEDMESAYMAISHIISTNILINRVFEVWRQHACRLIASPIGLRL